MPLLYHFRGLTKMSENVDLTTLGNLASYDIQEGAVYQQSSSIPAGAWEEVYRSTASPNNAGSIILIQAVSTFSGNNSGDRGIVIRVGSTDASAQTGRPPSASGMGSRMSASWVVTASSTSTFGVAVYQSSGSNLTVNTTVRTLRFIPKIRL